MFPYNHKELVIKIVEHAVKDWRLLEERELDKFCDSDHENICKDEWCDGRQELADFFNSKWFDHICDHIGIVPDAVRDELGITQPDLGRVPADNKAAV